MRGGRAARSVALWGAAVLSMLGWVGVGLSTAVMCLAMVPVQLLQPWVDPKRRLLHRIASLWGGMLVGMLPGKRVEVLGLEYLPRRKPAILMANHQSYVDVPLLFGLPVQFRWVADVALFWIPFLGWGMGMGGCVAVRRGDARSGQRALEQARRWLEKGISVFIFPEGTRSHTGVLGRFQSGGFRLAVETDTPIVPVVVCGTRQLLPRGGWIFRLGTPLQVRILPPVPPGPPPRSLRRLLSRVRSQMNREYGRMLKEVRR